MLRLFPWKSEGKKPQNLPQKARVGLYNYTGLDKKHWSDHHVVAAIEVTLCQCAAETDLFECLLIILDSRYSLTFCSPFSLSFSISLLRKTHSRGGWDKGRTHSGAQTQDFLWSGLWASCCFSCLMPVLLPSPLFAPSLLWFCVCVVWLHRNSICVSVPPNTPKARMVII